MISIWAILYLLFLHFVADFLLQPREMAENKSSSFKWLVLHGGIQFVVFAAASGMPIYISLINAIAHMFIDSTIWKGYKISVLLRGLEKKNFKYWKDKWFYNTIGLDQLLHCATIIFLYSR